MCYSAQIRAEYSRYLRQYGAELSLKEYFDLFWRRLHGGRKVRVPRSMEMVFAEPRGEEEASIKALIDEFGAAEATRLEQEIFKQRKRLADAQRSLQGKPTKKAAEDQRIATAKVETALGKLAALRRSEPVGDDLRIFPGWYAPVMVVENGRRVVKPMRYQCRPAGKPATHDQQFPGTYNARRDNLEGFWKGLFGRSHGILFAEAFFENVKRDGGNVVLEFRPRTGQDMLVACLWSRWTAPGEPELLSFAAITDEPPPEVAAAGHDRCIIPIKAEHLDAWLNPDPSRLQSMYDILDDRERPYYEHRLAA